MALSELLDDHAHPLIWSLVVYPIVMTALALFQHSRTEALLQHLPPAPAPDIPASEDTEKQPIQPRAESDFQVVQSNTSMEVEADEKAGSAIAPTTTSNRDGPDANAQDRNLSGRPTELLDNPTMPITKDQKIKLARLYAVAIIEVYLCHRVGSLCLEYATKESTVMIKISALMAFVIPIFWSIAIVGLTDDARMSLRRGHRLRKSSSPELILDKPGAVFLAMSFLYPAIPWIRMLARVLFGAEGF